MRETTLSLDDLVQPIFVNETIESPIEISSMPGVYSFPLSEVVYEAKEIAELGIPAVIFSECLLSRTRKAVPPMGN